ncbi:hypothetical protein Clacol_007078 [Clathrus columnatus]|uniref:Terpene synthase n=1 Tax=Clathrus columnatus TaxID=1419009 RepID=A0AAV5AIA1_9AGAM|nr:hypothetical protein Clacol_007078 [Clathrus columnatus]
MSLIFQLPNLHRSWPFPRVFNPYHKSIAVESSNWIDSFHLFSPARQLKFRLIEAGTLAALAYPSHTKEHFRVACDLMNLLFAMDDLSDPLDPHDARELADTALDALHFWERLSKTASRTCLDRFVKSYQAYMNAMVQEAEERDVHSIRTSIEDYLSLRRSTGAIKPSFDLILLPLEIPTVYLESPFVKQLEIIAIDLIAVANDVVSFNVEQARGDIHNIVIVLMNERDMTVQEAMDFVGDWYEARSKQFIILLNFVLENHSDKDPGQVDLKRYIRGLAIWVTANYEWSFESQRFFGSLHKEVYHHKMPSVYYIFRKVSLCINNSNEYDINMLLSDASCLDLSGTTILPNRAVIDGGNSPTERPERDVEQRTTRPDTVGIF